MQENLWYENSNNEKSGNHESANYYVPNAAENDLPNIELLTRCSLFVFKFTGVSGEWSKSKERIQNEQQQKGKK